MTRMKDGDFPLTSFLFSIRVIRVIRGYEFL